MADVLATNNAVSSLAAGITNAATTITVPAGEGARFPSPSAGNYFYLTLIDVLGNFEIVKCTARATDSMTITRAQDNTTAKAFSAGSSVQLLPVAALVTDLFAAINSKLAASSYTAADVLAKLLTVDGAGSGLDADLLDGQSSAYYTAITTRLGYTPINKAGDTGLSGNFQFNAGSRYIEIVDGVGSVLALGNTTTGASLVAYTKSHGGGAGGQFHLTAIDPADNSMSALIGNAATTTLSWNGYTVWTAQNDGSGSGLDADLLDGQESSYYRSASNLNTGTLPGERFPPVTVTTPTPTASSGSFTAASSVVDVLKLGYMRLVTVTITITTNGTAAGAILLDLPFTAYREGVLVGRQCAVGGAECQAVVGAGGASLTIVKYDNTYPGATGERITLSGALYANAY